jgi:hypothetical protein
VVQVQVQVVADVPATSIRLVSGGGKAELATDDDDRVFDRLVGRGQVSASRRGDEVLTRIGRALNRLAPRYVFGAWIVRERESAFSGALCPAVPGGLIRRACCRLSRLHGR